MRVRLRLKQPYTWPSRNPNKPNTNNIGFVQTAHPKFLVGAKYRFEDLHPYSGGGDLNPDHYHYFEGRTFVVTNTPPGMFMDFDLMEI